MADKQTLQLYKDHLAFLEKALESARETIKQMEEEQCP